MVDKKLMNKKLKDLTIKEVEEYLKNKENYNFDVSYKNITDDCKFTPFCSGGSNDPKYGCNKIYYDLAIHYKKRLIFRLDINSFKNKSTYPKDNVLISEGIEYQFHWLDNGKFMIVKKYSK